MDISTGGMRITHTADETAQLEDEDGGEISPLQGKILKQLSPGRCEGGHSQEECRTVPSNLGHAVELIRDLGDGGGHDGLHDKVSPGLLYPTRGAPASKLNHIPDRAPP